MGDVARPWSGQVLIGIPPGNYGLAFSCEHPLYDGVGLSLKKAILLFLVKFLGLITVGHIVGPPYINYLD